MKRLHIQLEQEDYKKLDDLRLLLALPSTTETVRTLIRLHHTAMRSSVRRLRKIQTNLKEGE
jgi:hypothetical protein